MATADVVKPDFATVRKHFIFTDEHEQLRESIRRFVIKELQPHADEWEEKTFPIGCSHGWASSGSWVWTSPRSTAVRVATTTPVWCWPRRWLTPTAAAWRWASPCRPTWRCRRSSPSAPRSRSGSGPPRRSPARRSSASGSPSPTPALTWPGSRLAVRDEATGDYLINGSKTYITNGHRAHAIVLVTKTDPDSNHDGFTLFLVPMDTPGVIREKRLKKLGMHASDTALLAFQDVRVPESAVLGQIGKGFYHISWELQGERLIGAAGCVAGAQHVFDRTLEYAKERKAFGRAIGHFQVIRHKFAEMATKIETARQMVYTTAWRFQNGEYPVREITMAKLYAARISVEVADECIQIHGGAGYMQEYGIERSWRDLRLNRIGAGTDEIMLDVIGRSYGL